MSEKPLFTATIRNEDRNQDWLTIFGSDTVPIKSPFATRTDLPKTPNARIYELNLNAITPDQRQALVAHIAKKFGYDPAYVEANLNDEGVPLLANDVTITIHRPELFL